MRKSHAVRTALVTFIVLCPIALAALTGCGKKTPLVPPDEDAPQAAPAPPAAKDAPDAGGKR